MENSYRRAITPEARAQLYKQATEALLQLHLAEGMAQTQALLYHCPNQLPALQLNAAQADYRGMLHFIRNGGDDPDRHLMQRRIALHVLAVLDDVDRQLRIVALDDDYAKARRRLDRHTPSVLSLDFDYDEENPKSYQIVFDYVWTAAPFTFRMLQHFQLFIANRNEAQQQMCVGALTMALLEYFDKHKLSLLMTMMQHPSLLVSAQAMLGYVLVVQQHGRRMELMEVFPEPLPDMGSDFQSLQQMLFLQKYCRQIQQRMKKLVEGMRQGDTSMDEIEEQLRQLRMDQTDLNPFTFEGAYRHPFFQEMCTWWLPYDQRHSREKEALQRKPALAPMFKFMKEHCCDVDVYALVQLMGTQGVEVKIATPDNPQQELNIDDMPTSQMPKLKPMARVLQNAYRFFRYSKWAEKYEHLFSSSLFLPQMPGMSALFPAESVRQLLDVLLRNQLYEPAIVCAQHIMEHHECDAPLLRQCAHCYQHEGQADEALRLYIQADLLQENHHHTILQMALCCMELGRHAEAEKHLLHLAQLPGVEPATYLQPLLQCRMAMGAWDEALQTCFEMRYLGMAVTQAWRGIVRCTLEMGRTDKAEAYCRQYLEQNQQPEVEDYLLAGHVQWLLGHWREAFDHYRQAIRHRVAEAADQGINDWDLFADFKPLLQRHGITQQDICLMHDMLWNDKE